MCQILCSQHIYLCTHSDWCLSRQIQWGHKIPAFYHKSHPEVWVAAFNTENAKKKLEAKLSIKIEDNSEILQDKDVLDTWFSSALIPLAVSNWPELDQKVVLICYKLSIK